MAAFHVVIPARYGSSRLPGKPLAVLAGKPMIQWVYEAACRSSAAEVLIATDDVRVQGAAQDFGATAWLTSAAHRSGSDRIAEVAARAGWSDETLVVNLQGDEPLMSPALVDQVASVLGQFASAAIATLCSPIGSLEVLLDPNVVKVVTDLQQRALYFSRAPIPAVREQAVRDAVEAADPVALASPPSPIPAVLAAARRHLGLYAYRVSALRRLASLAPTPLESLEQLEQLRALEHGLEVRVVPATAAVAQDVNTLQDLQRVEAVLSAHVT